MADLGQTFDASTVPDQQSFDTIPPGKYPVQITQSEMRDNKAGTGKYLWLEMQIIDGPSAGRLLWDRLNLINQNQVAVDIAYQTLGAICKAVGIPVCKDSEELHMRPMVANVKVRPAQNGYDAANEVKGYEPAGSKAPAAQAPQQAGSTSQPAWRRNRA